MFPSLSFLPPSSPLVLMLTCPQCQTTTLTNPRLQLLYSSCCGLCLCTDCIHTLFSSSSLTSLPCPSCSLPLTQKEFDPSPLSTQRFTKEVKVRAKLSRLLPLSVVDFEDESGGWDDYQEWLTDVVWDLVEGGKDEVKEGERKVDEWRKTNQWRIDRAEERRRGGERKEEEGGEVVGDGVVMPLIPLFMLPTPQLQPSLLHELDRELERVEGEERRKKKEERWEVWMKGRRAGGWRDEWGEQREREEMVEGWVMT